MGKIGVVGAGPIGLSTADQLSRRGFEVVVFGLQDSAIFRPTYPAAAAFWTPFCSGLDSARESLLSRASLEFYRDLRDSMGVEECAHTAGVIWRRIEQHFLSDHLVLPEWSSLNIGFVRARRDLKPTEHNLKPYPRLVQSMGSSVVKTRREFSYFAPVIQVDRFISWYRRSLVEKGVRLVDHSIPFVGPYCQVANRESALRDWRALIKSESLDGLVICTGCGAIYGGAVSADHPTAGAFSPRKGVIATISTKPAPEDRVILFEGGAFEREALYMVPQIERFVLGGTVYPAGITLRDDDWTVTVEEKEGIMERAMCFLPSRYRAILRSAVRSRAIEWRAGVRPVLANVGPVVEFSEVLTEFVASGSLRPPVYLHFGHGGSGFTLLQDTAIRLATLVEELGVRDSRD